MNIIMLKTDTTQLDRIIVGRVNPHIYAFSTETVPNYLKVGDTYRPVETRLDEWRKHFKNLKPLYKHEAKTEDGKFFRDYSVHFYLETEKGKERLKKATFPDVYYSNEFFKDASAADVAEAIDDIVANAKNNTGKYQLYSPYRLPETHHYERTQSYPLRPNQRETVDNFLNAVSKGRNNLLMYAVMRFGKSFTAMYCSKELANCKLTLIVSAKADVREEWKKTVESHVAFAEYVYLGKDELSNQDDVITRNIEAGKRVAVFLTLQELQGDNIKPRHKQIFSSQIDLLIVDETHYGARATQLGKILRLTAGLKPTEVDSEIEEKDVEEDFEKNDKLVKSLKARVKLHLSGTPYRILMGDEFKKEDIIAFCQFTDIVELQQQWDEMRLAGDECNNGSGEIREWDNPYYGFPQMVRFAFKPNASSLAKMHQLREHGYTCAMSALLRPCSIVKDESGKYKKFENEQEILDLLSVIDGTKNDDNVLGFLNYDRIKNGNMCRHMVFVLPYRASCDAMEALIKNNHNKFKNLSSYEILNISGVEQRSLALSNEDIKCKIRDCEEQGKKTITLTVNRMLTGSTVEQWDTMLYFKDTSSPQEYDQAIFRLQNQFVKTYKDEKEDIIKFNMKPQTLLVDFDPDRMFRMQELKSQFYNANVDNRGNDKLEERIRKELRISPIITLNNNKLSEVTPVNIMDAVRNYSQSKSIADESHDIPSDLGLLDIAAFRKEIEGLKEIDNNKGIEIRPITDKDVDDMDIPMETHEKADVHGNNDDTEKATKADEEESGLEKKLATYYSKILFFAFLTDNKVRNLSDIINQISVDKEDHRIACSLGLRLAILSLIRDKANVFILSKLDYKIQSINELMSDNRLEPVRRAEVAMRKFARLSNSEVVTPPMLANELIGLLPQESITDGTVFLDISSVQGEMACAIYRRYGEKTIDNIYSVATSALTYELTRKVYKLLGLPTDHVMRFSSYDLLNEKSSENKEQVMAIRPDVVCGVPPFNAKAEGGRGDGGTAEYHKFFNYSKDVISPRYICMLTQSTWYNGGRGDGLEEFRDYMLSIGTNDRHIRELHDYPDIEEYLKGVTTLRGGICLYMWDKSYSGNCLVVNHILHNDYLMERPLRFCYNGHKLNSFIRWNEGLAILKKVLDKETHFITDNGMMRKRDPFGFVDNGSDKKYAGTRKSKNCPIKVYLANGKTGYVSENAFVKEKGKDELLNKWKVLVAKSSSGTDKLPHMVISDPVVSEPKSVTAHTHYVIEGVSSQVEADNLADYLKTRFARFMMLLLRSNQNMRV
ncbi:MAG: DEAD/DEAH box helicase family protein, partial [Prevotella sp.]